MMVAAAVLAGLAAAPRLLPSPATTRLRELGPAAPGPGSPQSTRRFRRRRIVAHRRQPAVLVAVGIGVVTGSPFLAGAVLATWWAVHTVGPMVAERRRLARVGRAAPDAIELVILTIHAGLSPVQAVRELVAVVPADVRPGFGAVVHRLDRGEPFAQAVRALPEHLGNGMVAFADVIAGADRYGVPIGPVLESLAAEVRAARRRLDEADARRLPIRLSFPLVLCTLPSFVLLAIAPAVIAAFSSLSLDV